MYPQLYFFAQILKRSLMFKSVNKDVWVFDVEWVPDPEAGRSLFELTEVTTDIDVLKQMWEKGGADE